MAFLYVDRITEYQPRTLIRGIKNVTRSEPLLSPGNAGRKVAHPALLIEASAQLGAWLAIRDHEFRKRPLFLGEDLAEVHGSLQSGDRVELTVWLIRYNDDVVETRTEAYVGDRLIFRTECGRGYLVPMEDYDDPEVVKKRYNELYRPNLKQGPSVVALPDTSHEQFWRMSRTLAPEFFDGVIKHEPWDEVVTFKNITLTESYFDCHFPRHPVVPGVIMLAMGMAAADLLVRDQIEALNGHYHLKLKKLANGRFRKKVEPGDQCETIAKVKSWDPTTRQLVVTTTLRARGQRASQVELTYEVPTNIPTKGPTHAPAV